MSTPSWSEDCYCKRCDLSFTSDTPDAVCPKCGRMDRLFDSKEIANKTMNPVEQPEKRPLKDSGERRTFGTEAVRDVTGGKGTMHLLPPYAVFRWARHMEKGNVKYGPRNWERGIPLSSFWDSGMRHWLEVLMGLTDEDHETAALWNVGGYIETNFRIKLGMLPEKLDDMPHTYSNFQEKMGELMKTFGDNILRV